MLGHNLLDTSFLMKDFFEADLKTFAFQFILARASFVFLEHADVFLVFDSHMMSLTVNLIPHTTTLEKSMQNLN